MAPPSSQPVKNDAARARPRHDTRFKAQDGKKTGKVPARHPRTGRKQWDSTPTAPLPKSDLRVSPERPVDMSDSGWRNSTEGDFKVYEGRMRMFYEQVCSSSFQILTGKFP